MRASHHAARSSALLAALILAALGEGALADQQPFPASRGAQDDVPPFPSSRGPLPLALSVTGLSSGVAKVVAGSRAFAVCWQGGAAPFLVTLRDPNGRQVVNDSTRANELVLASKPTTLVPGPYEIEVVDGAGHVATGRFVVIAPADAPTVVRKPPEPAAGQLGAAKTLASVGPEWRFAAYLAVVFDAVAQPGSAADAFARQLCHRKGG